jgi:hypothetical protein
VCERVVLLAVAPRFAAVERLVLFGRVELLALLVRALVPERRPACEVPRFPAADRDDELLRVVAPRVAADLLVDDFLPDVPRVDFRVVAIPCSMRRVER